MGRSTPLLCNWYFIIAPGGHMTNNQTIIDVALELVDSCWNTYASTALVFHFSKHFLQAQLSSKNWHRSRDLRFRVQWWWLHEWGGSDPRPAGLLRKTWILYHGQPLYITSRSYRIKLLCLAVNRRCQIPRSCFPGYSEHQQIPFSQQRICRDRGCE